MSFDVRFNVRPSELKDGIVTTLLVSGGYEEIRTLAKVSELAAAAEAVAKVYGRPCIVSCSVHGARRKPAGFENESRRLASVFHKGLDAEQREALREFAAEYGERWKAELGTLWMRGAARPTLHALRNSHGPEWLSRFELFAEGSL